MTIFTHDTMPVKQPAPSAQEAARLAAEVLLETAHKEARARYGYMVRKGLTTEVDDAVPGVCYVDLQGDGRLMVRYYGSQQANGGRFDYAYVRGGSLTKAPAVSRPLSGVEARQLLEALVETEEA